MSLETLPVHLTIRQLQVICEGLKMVVRNPKSSCSEAATAERLQACFENIIENSAKKLVVNSDQG